MCDDQISYTWRVETRKGALQKFLTNSYSVWIKLFTEVVFMSIYSNDVMVNSYIK